MHGRRHKGTAQRSQQERDKLVLANQGLVYALVRQLRQRSPFIRMRLDEEDALQEGQLGLINAAKLYDAKLGFAFSTYAGQAIRRQVLLAARKNGTVATPIWVQEAMTRVLHGKKPSCKLRSYLRCVPRARQAVQCRKLTQLKANGLLDRHKDHQEDYRMARLRQLLGRLRPSERRLIEQRFYHDLNLDKIAAEEGVTKQRVQQ